MHTSVPCGKYERLSQPDPPEFKQMSTSTPSSFQLFNGNSSFAGKRSILKTVLTNKSMIFDEYKVSTSIDYAHAQFSCCGPVVQYVNIRPGVAGPVAQLMFGKNQDLGGFH